MKKKNNEYYSSRHSCFLLQYHLVLVTRYRHPVMVDALRERMINVIDDFFIRWEFPILQMEVCPDHIHVLFEASPNVALASFVNGLKTYTSRIIRKEFSELLAQYYWKPYFWSMSYFIASVSERSTQVVKHYIATQDLDR